MPFEAAPMVNVTPLKARGKSGGGGRLGVSSCVYFIFLVAVAVVGKFRHILVLQVDCVLTVGRSTIRMVGLNCICLSALHVISKRGVLSSYFVSSNLSPNLCLPRKTPALDALEYVSLGIVKDVLKMKVLSMEEFDLMRTELNKAKTDLEAITLRHTNAEGASQKWRQKLET